jgi:hypothetical protein
LVENLGSGFRVRRRDGDRSEPTSRGTDVHELGPFGVNEAMPTGLLVNIDVPDLARAVAFYTAEQVT